MAAVNNKKTKNMECSYLKDHQLAFLLFSAGRHLKGNIKKNV